MAFKLPIHSPLIRHEDSETDIFGPNIVLDHEGGFTKFSADEIKKVTLQ
ncbi:hypothetical protein [Tuberibacillus sp. Marseille-P3662]|nr:hypothetical protein [Tuberibacillus sp. Marseille-P3662]